MFLFSFLNIFVIVEFCHMNIWKDKQNMSLLILNIINRMLLMWYILHINEKSNIISNYGIGWFKKREIQRLPCFVVINIFLFLSSSKRYKIPRRERNNILIWLSGYHALIFEFLNFPNKLFILTERWEIEIEINRSVLFEMSRDCKNVATCRTS